MIIIHSNSMLSRPHFLVNIFIPWGWCVTAITFSMWYLYFTILLNSIMHGFCSFILQVYIYRLARIYTRFSSGLPFTLPNRNDVIFSSRVILFSNQLRISPINFWTWLQNQKICVILSMSDWQKLQSEEHFIPSFNNKIFVVTAFKYSLYWKFISFVSFVQFLGII